MMTLRRTRTWDIGIGMDMGMGMGHGQIEMRMGREGSAPLGFLGVPPSA